MSFLTEHQGCMALDMDTTLSVMIQLLKTKEPDCSNITYELTFRRGWNGYTLEVTSTVNKKT